MQENNIVLARRQSGGGTVYHDLGNSCITIFSKKHDPETNLRFACDALKTSFGLNAHIGPRKDIFVDDFKVSGSAFRITNRAAYHHFTLLLSTDLSNLHKALVPTHAKLDSKATPSVRSKVKNIGDHLPNRTIEHQDIIESFSSHFIQTKYGSPSGQIGPIEIFDEDQIRNLPEVQTLHNQITSWDYIFGKTPEFSQNLSVKFKWSEVRISIRVESGRIIDMEVDSAMDFVVESALRNGCVGQPYHHATLIETLKPQEAFIHDQELSDQFQELSKWFTESIRTELAS